MRNVTTLHRGESETLHKGAIAVNVHWSVPLDLDLAALCVSKTRPTELVYHANEGRRMSSPYCHLSHDGDSSARTKDRREHLVVLNHSALDRIHLYLWDHKTAQAGGCLNAHELEGDVKIELIDRMNRVIEIPLEATGKEWNCLQIGTIAQGHVIADQAVCRIEGPSTHVKNLRKLAGLREDEHVTC